MQWQNSGGFSAKSHQHCHFLSLLANSHLKNCKIAPSSSTRFSEILHLPILDAPPKPAAANSIIAAAVSSKKRILRKRQRKLVRSGALNALLEQCIASFVASQLSLLPEPLDSLLLLLLSDGGGNGGWGFWKKRYGGGRGGPRKWKLGQFLGLLLLFGTAIFLIWKKRCKCKERDLPALWTRLRMIPKWFGRRSRRRLWAF